MYNYFYMIEIIQAAHSIIPAAELTFPSLHMYLYIKIFHRIQIFPSPTSKILIFERYSVMGSDHHIFHMPQILTETTRGLMDVDSYYK